MKSTIQSSQELDNGSVERSIDHLAHEDDITNIKTDDTDKIDKQNLDLSSNNLAR